MVSLPWGLESVFASDVDGLCEVDNETFFFFQLLNRLDSRTQCFGGKDVKVTRIERRKSIDEASD
jgi:hypothetical protein